MTCSTLKLLSSPYTLMSMTPKQRRSIFFKASLTATHYLGAPTDCSKADMPDLIEYVSEIFHSEDNGCDLMLKCVKLKRPKLNLRVTVKNTCLSKNTNLPTYGKLFFKIGTTTRMDYTSTSVPVSYSPEWNEVLILSTDDDSNLVFEVWMKASLMGPHCLGQLTLSFDCIPNNEEVTLFLYKGDSIVGTVKLQCIFQVKAPASKVQEQYRHLLLCYLVFEHQLSAEMVSSSLKVFKKGNSLCGQGLSNILSDTALTLLHQNALQSGLTPWENVTCCFMVLSEYFRKTSFIEVDVLLTILRQMTTMRRDLKMPMDTLLKDTIKYIMQACAKHCKKLFIQFLKNSKEDHGGFEKLRQTSEYLEHVRVHYLPDVTWYVSDYIPRDLSRILEFPNLSEAIKKCGQTSEFKTVDAISEITNAVSNLIIGDSILKNMGFRVTYASLVVKCLDARLSTLLEKFVVAFKKALNANNNLLVAGDLLVKAYEQVLHLITYLDKHDSSETTVALLRKWAKSFPPEAFLSFFRILMQNHELCFVSVLQVGQKLDQATCNLFVDEVLDEWRKLLLFDSVSPTEALLRVCAEQYMNVVVWIKENLFPLDNEGKGECLLSNNHYLAMVKIAYGKLKHEILSRRLDETEVVELAAEDLAEMTSITCF